MASRAPQHPRGERGFTPGPSTSTGPMGWGVALGAAGLCIPPPPPPDPHSQAGCRVTCPWPQVPAWSPVLGWGAVELSVGSPQGCCQGAPAPSQGR